MARFQMEIPTDMIKAFEELGANAGDMLGEMTKAGAEAVVKSVEANVPKSFRSSDIMDCLHITKVYKTPSDGGINTKVAFYGYFTNKRGETVPAELVCNVMEYGRSDGKVNKHPFMRKSFKSKDVRTAMQKKQDEWFEKFQREFEIT